MGGVFNQTWLLTWTTKGTWLPGDRRGWISGANLNAPGSPSNQPSEALRNWCQNRMQGSPVWMNQDQAQVVLESHQETAQFQSWWLGAMAVMPNHVHVVVGGPKEVDGVKFLSRFKSYASRALNARWGKQDWWTDYGSARALPDLEAVQSAINYVANQQGPLVLWVNKD